MQNKNAILKAALVMGISAFALTACESMGMSDWFEDDATYAGDVKPPVQGVDTTAASNQVVPPPSPQILQNLPQSAPQPSAPQFTSSLSTPDAPAAPPVVNQYTGNLASVPARPSVSDLPGAAMVQSTRQQLTADNQQLTNTLNNPSAAMTPVASPLIPNAPTTLHTLSEPAAMAAATAPPPPPPPQPMVTTAEMMSSAVTPNYVPPAAMQSPVATPVQQSITPPVPYAAMPYGATSIPAPTDQNVSGRMLGLQTAGPGKYSLVQLQPDTGIGSFSMAASIVMGQGNQININQYQDLRHVATQQMAQHGRVRLVAYSNDPQSQEALQRATTVAAYLIDLGVPSTAVRMRIDPLNPDATAATQQVHKTDIFLEVPLTQ